MISGVHSSSFRWPYKPTSHTVCIPDFLEGKCHDTRLVFYLSLVQLGKKICPAGRKDFCTRAHQGTQGLAVEIVMEHHRLRHRGAQHEEVVQTVRVAPHHPDVPNAACEEAGEHLLAVLADTLA